MTCTNKALYGANAADDYDDDDKDEHDGYNDEMNSVPMVKKSNVPDEKGQILEKTTKLVGPK